MSDIKYITPKDVAHLQSLQATAVKATLKARVSIQVALVATLLHMGKYGDRRVADGFVEALGNTVNGKAIVAWFVQFGGLSVNPEGTGFDGFAGQDHIVANLTEAKSTMWWELKVQAAFKGYNADAEMQRVIKNYQSWQAKAATLDEDKKASVNLTISEETIKAFLSLADFDAILDAELTEAVNA